jgi:pimeloyl-ACP methyl ester carboxylesterase
MTAASACGYCEPMRQTTGFARLPDGGRIAFAVVGNGPAVVMPAWWVSNVVEDWRNDPLRRFIENLAAARMVVRYDRLGTGMSDRERPPETFTLDFEDAALCAVLDELGLARLSLLGISCGGCTAVHFAASALGSSHARASMIDLVRSHWGLGSRLLADIFGPSLVSRGPGCLHRDPARRSGRRSRRRPAHPDLRDRRARRPACRSCAGDCRAS